MNRRTRVKICGITRREDANAAVECGADAIGLVFVARSPRFVEPAEAAIICRELQPMVSSVALFMDPEPALVRTVISTCRPTLLQFHGQETPAFCESFDRPYMKAIAMGGEQSLDAQCSRYSTAAAWLLDSHAPGEMGGSGQVFDWAQAGSARDRPLVLAGGLRPDNVGAAVASLRPYAVDVSSGVESRPGHKDPQLMKRFIEEVRHADAR